MSATPPQVPPTTSTKRKPGNHGNRLTQQTYDSLTQQYRERPAAHHLVAANCGINWRTAKRAWEVGYPQHGWPPISEVVAEEQVIARARVVELEQEVHQQRADRAREIERSKRENREALSLQRERARQDAIEARTQEAQAVKVGRQNAIALLAAQNKLIRGSLKLAERMQEQLEQEKLELRPSIKVMGELSRAVNQATEAAQRVIQMERLLIGAPTEIIGHVGSDAMSIEEAVDLLEQSERVLNNLRRRTGEIVEAEVVESQPLAVQDDVQPEGDEQGEDEWDGEEGLPGGERPAGKLVPMRPPRSPGSR